MEAFTYAARRPSMLAGASGAACASGNLRRASSTAGARAASVTAHTAAAGSAAGARARARFSGVDAGLAASAATSLRHAALGDTISAMGERRALDGDSTGEGAMARATVQAAFESRPREALLRTQNLDATAARC